jgi:hypothetical protein
MVSIKWLWATKKSSERWLAKNPPEPCRDIIRVGGSLLTVRPAADELVKGAGAPRGRSGDGAGGNAGGRGHSGEGPQRIRRPTGGPSPRVCAASEPEISLIWQQAACVQPNEHQRGPKAHQAAAQRPASRCHAV